MRARNGQRRTITSMSAVVTIVQMSKKETVERVFENVRSGAQGETFSRAFTCPQQIALGSDDVTY